MKNLPIVLGIRLLSLFSILFLYSCSSPEQKVSDNEITKEKTVHSIDTVIIQQMQFIPAALNIKIGDTVVWINKDIVDHNVTEEKSKSWTSDTLHIGKSWKMAVTDSANYFCTIHPTMKGKLLLK